MRHWARLVAPKVAMCVHEGSAMELFDEDLWDQVWKKLKAFEAPGPDGIRNYIYIQIQAVYDCLKRFIVRMVDGEAEIPRWLMEGRTTLIHKGGNTQDPANYQPIACLNTAYKIMTAVLASDAPCPHL
eukprot:gene4130-biopygen2591